MNLSDIEFGKTRVTHSNFDSGEGTVIAEAPRLYSEGEDRVSVKWDTPARHLTNISATHQVSYLEAVAPAPLDPSKVKAGDTVTLEHPDGSRIADRKVSSVYAVLVGKRQEYLNDLYASGFTLTVHQPKPQLKPGTKGTGTINGHKVDGFISEMNGTIGLYYWSEFAGHTSYTGMVPEDFTPDVVIDTDVVDELVDSLSHALGERLPPDAVAYISRTDGNNDRRKWVRGLLSHAQPNLVRSPLQVLGLAE